MSDLSSTAIPGGKETDSNSELQRLRTEVSRYRKLFYFSTAVLVVMLLAGAIGSAIMSMYANRLRAELRRQEQIAKEEAEVSAAVNEFLKQELLELAGSAPK